jgi:hypothetical protein
MISHFEADRVALHTGETMPHFEKDRVVLHTGKI